MTKKFKILIFGSNGLVGNSMGKILKQSDKVDAVFSSTRKVTDLEFPEQINSTIKKQNPDYIINLTRSFAVMAKKDSKSLRKFQEKPLQDQPAFENKSVSKDSTDRRSQYIEDKFKVSYRRSRCS